MSPRSLWLTLLVVLFNSALCNADPAGPTKTPTKKAVAKHEHNAPVAKRYQNGQDDYEDYDTRKNNQKQRRQPNQFYLQVPPPQNRDQFNCEPYEDMILEEDDCHIYCMLNGKIGVVFLRDLVRRPLQRCLGPRHVCSFCQMNVLVHYGGNVTVEGRCHEDCSCRHVVSSDIRMLNDDVKECALAKANKFLGSRKDVPDRIADVELHIPQEQTRNQQTCEPYESTSITLPAGDPLVDTFQCTSFCTVSGSIGILNFRSNPRVLNFNAFHNCRSPISPAFSRNVHLRGVMEVLPGFCNNGLCATDATKQGTQNNNNYDTDNQYNSNGYNNLNHNHDQSDMYNNNHNNHNNGYDPQYVMSDRNNQKMTVATVRPNVVITQAPAPATQRRPVG